MAKRSITNEEIGLIKAMLARGMKNKNIQFYFNRQDRAVNSGRMTNIANGSYGPEVPIASEEALSSFIENFATPTIAAPSINLGEPTLEPLDPMDEKVLRSFFAKDAKGSWRCIVGETDEFECKENFNLRGFGKPLKTIAGFANHRGGYLFFGVKDKPDNFLVCGMSDNRFTDTDQNKFSQTIRAALEPTPRFRVATLSLGSLKVGVIYVEAHSSKPVIAGKTEGELIEGIIYFRYSGETRPICYADLRAILDERDQRSREAILPMVQRLLELGPKDAMVANLLEGKLEGADRPIVIDQQLVDRIKFIRDGEFNEVEGAETLRLVGEVNAVNLSTVTEIKTVRTEVTEEAIIRNFVERAVVEEPMAYVRQASREQSFNLPIFYFLHLAGKTRAEAVSELRANHNAKPRTATEMIKRLHGKRNLFAKAGGERLQMLSRIRDNEVIDINSVEQAKVVVGALTGLTATDDDVFDYANQLVTSAMNFWSQDRGLMSLARKAAARLDELVYGPLVK
ncbi:MAG: ATP-binding protein [Aquidulcibacter sp.]|nr:ATP-binding protein [Aquidulcibacter sp.]